jgi:hypothetical protein
MRFPVLFPQRLPRLPYSVRLVLAFLLMIAGHYVMEFLFTYLPPHPPHWARVVLPKVNPVLWLCYILFFVAVPRFRDTGIAWWAYIVLVIPLLGPIALLSAMFVPTNYFNNAKA